MRKSWITAILMLALVALPVACKQGEQGPAGSQGPSGPPGKEGPAGKDLKGNSTGGGGGFVHKNSKILFQLTKEAIIKLIKNADEKSFEPLGTDWNKERVLMIFENLIMAPEESVIRNGKDELLYDYGYNEKTGEHWLKVLKPFFDFHSSVAVKGPKDEYFYRVQTQITIELFHELSHLVLNHPKGKVSAKEVKKIESEASRFAENLMMSLATEGIVCVADFSPDMFSLNPEPKDDKESEEKPEEKEPTEYLVWTFMKYSNRGVVLKTDNVPEVTKQLEILFQQKLDLDQMKFLKNGYDAKGKMFPPSPDFDKFYSPLTNVLKIWHSVFYEFSTKAKRFVLRIRKYIKGFAKGLEDPGGGLIARLERVEDVLWESVVKFDFRKSRHYIGIDRQSYDEAIYRFFNYKKDIYEDQRDIDDIDDIKKVDHDQMKEIEIDCKGLYRSFLIPDPWPDR